MSMDWPAMTPEQAPPLGNGVVHAWWCAGGAEAVVQRRRYLDALLQRLLGGYVDEDPATLVLGREPRGRPFLSDANGKRRSPDFNLSDCAGHSLVVVSRTLRVGVDVERTNRRLRHRELAQRYFAPDEAVAINALDDAAGKLQFLRLWTAKEAACKATGTGLGGHMHRWAFAINDGIPTLIDMPDEAGSADDWRFLTLTPPDDGFLATIALRGNFERLCCFRLASEVS
ncbi:MAG: 4'-phosphopantetheinyl transferase superfamily protein [Xanthomonadales bacterium]|nr:4'-phosphopantetheinyl transferase superfamily protein [Xanthomonadales bacterium]